MMRNPRRRAASILVAAATMLLALLGASSAWAAVGLSAVPQLPTPLTVGQTGVPASLTITNNSDPTGPQSTQSFTVNGFGSFPPITYVPSCGTVAFSGACPAASVDPGVFSPSPTATGRSGTVCAGKAFTLVNIDPTQDRYQFNSTTPVVLGPVSAGRPGTACTIDFTVDVLKLPTKDADPATAGLQTVQLGFASGTTTDGTTGFGGGTNFVTVNPAPVVPLPQIALTKVASPLSLPAPGGTFTFTAQVSNPSTTTPVTITSLVDNIYGDLSTRPGSTCGALIGTTLAPGATSPSCTFKGPFTGVAGASQTDTITVTGVNNGTTVTAIAQATVTLTPAPAATPAPKVKAKAKHKKRKHHKPRKARKHAAFTG